RIVGAPAKGHFSGMFGEQWNHFPIPPAVLEKEHQGFATRVMLTQAISAYEDLLSRSGKNGTITFPWPPNLVLYYQEKIPTSKSTGLVAAYQEVARSAIVALVDTVRNRTLNMALELQSSFGDQDFGHITSAEIAQVDRTVVNNIYGGSNYFASGQSVLHASTINIQGIIGVGDKTQLEAVLRSSGLSDNDVAELSAAEKKDGEKTIGDRVKDWIKGAAPKVLAGG